MSSPQGAAHGSVADYTTKWIVVAAGMPITGPPLVSGELLPTYLAFSVTAELLQVHALRVGSFSMGILNSTYTSAAISGWLSRAHSRISLIGEVTMGVRYSG